MVLSGDFRGIRGIERQALLPGSDLPHAAGRGGGGDRKRDREIAAELAQAGQHSYPPSGRCVARTYSASRSARACIHPLCEYGLAFCAPPFGEKPSGGGSAAALCRPVRLGRNGGEGGASVGPYSAR